MKKVFLTLFVVVLLIIPFSVVGLTYSELKPDVIVEGIDENLYYINKIIDDKFVTIELNKKDEQISYSWSFDKNEIEDILHLNFELNFNSEKKNEIDMVSKNNDKLYLSFTHHGNLPSSAKMKVFVGNKYQNGENLYLYYYNDETKQVEYIDENLKVEKGYVEFEIDHCSEYFLTTTIVNDAVSNPKNMNYVILILAAVIIILVGATIFSTRK